MSTMLPASRFILVLMTEKFITDFMYTDSGYWDTFRAAHPLYNLLFPEISSEIVQAILSAHQESGWLPQWSSPGNRNAMQSAIMPSLFSLHDAWVRNIRSFDIRDAVSAEVHDAHNEGFFGMGRHRYKFFDQLGYVPYPELPDATAETLEYSYDDFCAATLARAAGREDAETNFARSAMNYTNVFDASTGFVRGRTKDGPWCTPFDPVEWGGPFVEGNATAMELERHTGHSRPHQIIRRRCGVHAKTGWPVPPPVRKSKPAPITA